ncbi:cofilin, partial [Paragonimus westermani]
QVGYISFLSPLKGGFCFRYGATYDDFKQDLLDAMDEGEGRYAVFDYECPMKMPTLIFVSWYANRKSKWHLFRTPSVLNIRKKLIYAASKDAIQKKLIGIKHAVEANDLDEIEEEEIRKKFE